MSAEITRQETGDGKFPLVVFDRFRKFLAIHSGITLSDNKSYLVESRLRGILEEKKIPSIESLLDSLEKRQDLALIDQIVDAMTTNETFWFRDSNFYNYLGSRLLPTLFENAKPGQTINVWSAASSSGQEAYSFSILVEQCVQVFRGKKLFLPEVNILGTDISRPMIEQAQAAIYSSLELSRGLSESMFNQYFDKVSDRKATVKDILKKRVKFQVHNLLDSFDSLGQFDIIFCRNVLIYFDKETVDDILQRMHAALKPNGVLFLSYSETINNLGHLYKAESTYPGFLYRAIK